jgi:hypothetical protein
MKKQYCEYDKVGNFVLRRGKEFKNLKAKIDFEWLKKNHTNLAVKTKYYAVK